MKRFLTPKAVSPDSSVLGQGRAKGHASLGSCDVRGATLRPEVDCVCVCRGGGGAGRPAQSGPGSVGSPPPRQGPGSVFRVPSTRQSESDSVLSPCSRSHHAVHLCTPRNAVEPSHLHPEFSQEIVCKLSEHLPNWWFRG